MIGLQHLRPNGPRWIAFLVIPCAVLGLIYFASKSDYLPAPSVTWGSSSTDREKATQTTNCTENDTSNHAAQVFAELWKPLIHPIDDPVFITDKGERFEIPPTSQRWMHSLGKRVVLIDTDTRLDEKKEDSMLHEGPLNYTRLPGRTGGHLNHYLYALIHGYDYRLIRAPNYPDRHGTWVKPAVIKEALKRHDFVISLDSDAVFTHLNLPIEWLMNLWDVTPQTLVAMAEDIENSIDYDSHGKLILNTGFVITQASERNQEMMEVWEDCPNRIAGCDKWKKKWAHEQSAFSEYIRYEFNETDEVKNIPCSHANGNEYYDNGKGACQGVFVSHNWHTKAKTVEILQRSVMNGVIRNLHGQFHADRAEVFVDGSGYTYPITDMPV